MSEDLIINKLKEINKELSISALNEDFYIKNENKIFTFFNSCTRYYTTASTSGRYWIRETIARWLNFLAFTEKKSIFIDFPRPSEEFNWREVPLSVILDYKKRKNYLNIQNELVKKKENNILEYCNNIAAKMHDQLYSKYNKMFSGINIAFGVPRFYDTLLLKVFWDELFSKMQFYSDLKSDVHFKYVPWGKESEKEPLDYFREQQIDYGVHSFDLIFSDRIDTSPQNLYMGLKLYTFSGHSIFMSAQYLDKYIYKRQKNGYDTRSLEHFINNKKIQLDQNEQRELIRAFRAKIAVEPNTDLEWAVRDIFENELGLSAANDFKLEYMSSDEGLENFLKGDVDIYCGGLNQSYYLEKGEEHYKARVLYSKEAFKDKLSTFNGLIARENSFDNKEEILFISVLWSELKSFLRLMFNKKNEDDMIELLRTKVLMGVNEELPDPTDFGNTQELFNLYKNNNYFFDDIILSPEDKKIDPYFMISKDLRIKHVPINKRNKISQIMPSDLIKVLNEETQSEIIEIEDLKLELTK